MLKINWWKELSGTIKVSGSKNAVLKIIPAALLINKVTLKNVPEIADVYVFCDILKVFWVKTEFYNNILKIDSTNIRKSESLDLELFEKIRASIMLLAPILQRLWEVNIPIPGWDRIWKRPIDNHINWLRKSWYDIEVNNENHIVWKWKTISWGIEINAWFSVTATENIIIANVSRKWETTIKLAAIEPHVMNLIDFLRKAWADIKIRYDHTIIVSWVDNLKDDIEFSIISDYLESGTFLIIGALLARDYLTIENARVDDLFPFLEKLKEAWVRVEDLWNDSLRVYKTEKIKPVNIQTNIYPGFPTDLWSVFILLMTQAEGISNIHEILYEWRLNWLVELESMWSNLRILNPHEAIIVWKTDFVPWKTVTSWDLRAGVSMIIAALLTPWETKVDKVEYIFRWYEKLVEKLSLIWADIKKYNF